MRGRYIAAAGLILLAGFPVAIGLVQAGSLTALPQTLFIRSLFVLVIAAALIKRRRGAWLFSVFISLAYAVLSLLVTLSGQFGDWWLVADDPRRLLVLSGLLFSISAGTFAALLLPATRRATTEAGSPLQTAIPLVIAALALTPGWMAWSRYPQLVNDQAGLLSASEKQAIRRYHGLLRTDHDIDYRVVVGENLGDINRYAARYYASHEIGQASTTGKGLLLVIDTAADRVRLEVGYELEPIFTDAFTAYIEQRQMTAFFAASQVSEGILATTELMITRAGNAAQGVGPARESWMLGSGGAGASTDARLDQGAAPRSTKPALDEDGNPSAVLDAYRQAMAERNNNPNLSLYSEQTRTMLSQRVMTDAQMDNVAQSLESCSVEKRLSQGGFAVLRPPIADRTCPPYFFRQENGAWRLDFTVMVDAIRFGRGNKWRLAPQYSGPYRFAFADLQFDQHGYPLEPR